VEMPPRVGDAIGVALVLHADPHRRGRWCGVVAPEEVDDVSSRQRGEVVDHEAASGARTGPRPS